MKCSKCGALNQGMEFCEGCASDLASESVKDTIIVCTGSLEDGSMCGYKIEPNQRFCSHCGMKVNQTKTAQINEKCAEMINTTYECGRDYEPVVDTGCSNIQCQPCKARSKSTIATMFCETCNEYQCQNCSHGHMINSSRSHLLVSSDVARNKSPVLDLKGLDKCDKHKEYLKLFCKDDNEMCCSICAFIGHRYCKDVIEITACRAVTCLKEKENLVELMENNSSTISNLNSAKRNIEKQKEDIVKEIDSMRTRIFEHFDQFATNIIQELNTIQNKKVQEFETISLKCTSLHKSLTSEIDFVNNIEQHGTPDQKFIIQQILKKRLIYYLNTAYELESNIVTTNLMLVLDKTLDILANSTSELGSLNVSEVKSKNTIKDMKGTDISATRKVAAIHY